MLRLSAEKRYIHKAAKRGDRRTNLRSASPMARGAGYLWDKAVAWWVLGAWEKVMIGDEKKVRQS